MTPNRKFDPVLWAARLTSKHYTPPRGAQQLKHALRSVQSAHGGRKHKALRRAVDADAREIATRKPVTHKRHVSKVRKRYESKAYREYKGVCLVLLALNETRRWLHRRNSPGYNLAQVAPKQSILPKCEPLVLHALPRIHIVYQRHVNYAARLAKWAKTEQGQCSMRAVANYRARHKLQSPLFVGFKLKGR